jgi:Tol biopolymer transport system component
VIEMRRRLVGVLFLVALLTAVTACVRPVPPPEFRLPTFYNGSVRGTLRSEVAPEVCPGVRSALQAPAMISVFDQPTGALLTHVTGQFELTYCRPADGTDVDVTGWMALTCCDSPSGAPGTNEVSGPARVVRTGSMLTAELPVAGGTGRYRDATGVCDLSAWIGFGQPDPPPPSSVEADGMLTCRLGGPDGPPPPPLFHLLTSELPDAVRSQPYGVDLSATGGTPPYVWSADGLPAGLRIEGGAITGAPTEPGDATVDLTVRDAAGLTRSTELTLFTNDPEIVGSIGPVSTDPTRLWSGLTSAVSDDGQVVAFTSAAAGLTEPPGVYGGYDVYVWDRAADTMRILTDDSSANYWDLGISGDGGTVVFSSDNPNLVPGDTNRGQDAFLVDTASGAITKVSQNPSGASVPVAVSDDGGTVVHSRDTDDGTAVFVWDRVTGTSTQVAVGIGGTWGFDISDDGSRIAFISEASNLVPGDTNGTTDAFLVDTTTGAIDRLEAGAGVLWGVAISGDGGRVVFASTTTALVPPGAADTNRGADLFLADPETLDVVRLTNGNAPSNTEPTISDDGRIIAFNSTATNLARGELDRDEHDDVFLWNADTGLISRLTRSRGNLAYGSSHPAVSGDGRTVAFDSGDSTLAPGATTTDNSWWFQYVWTRSD